MGKAQERQIHCKHGHKFTPENTYVIKRPGGGRGCRTCGRTRQKTDKAREQGRLRMENRRRASGIQARFIAPAGMQRCPSLHHRGERLLPLRAEYWARDSTHLTGFDSWCKRCRRVAGDHLRRARGQRIQATTHCYRGHEFAPENTYTLPTGIRQCRVCARLRDPVERARRAARESALPNTLTVRHWLALLDFYQERCAYCGISMGAEELDLEHVIPIKDRRAGTEPANVVPSCDACNSSKWATPVRQFLAKRHNSAGRALVSYEEFRQRHVAAIAYLMAVAAKQKEIGS